MTAGIFCAVNALGETPAEALTQQPSSKFLGDYLHVCDRSGEILDEFDDDFRHCRCHQPSAEVLALQDAISVRLDAGRR